jgi:hypothetical protein
MTATVFNGITRPGQNTIRRLRPSVCGPAPGTGGPGHTYPCQKAAVESGSVIYRSASGTLLAYDGLLGGANCEMEDVMNSRVGLAFLIGVAVGAATALLFAPQSGEETREWISDKARESLDQTTRVVEDAFAKGADAIERGKDRASDAAKKVYTRATAALG